MPVKSLRPAWTTVLLVLAATASAQDTGVFDYRPATVVVYNENHPDSKEVAEYYAKARSIPAANLVPLKCPTTETITRDQFFREIDLPLRGVFTERRWWEIGSVPKEGNIAVKASKRVIVTVRGVPLRISEKPPGRDPRTGQEVPPEPLKVNAASVDSELACLGVLDHVTSGPLNNPFFRNPKPFAQNALAPIFLTGRIDGPDKATALRLIDDAIAVEQEGGLYGRAYIDFALKNESGYRQGEEWLQKCAAGLERNGFPTIVDSLPTTFPKNYPMTGAAIYLGWYTEHVDGPFLNPGFRFTKGAVACHIHSFSASTLSNPVGYWTAPLLARGAAFAPGNVWEPYLSMCPWLDIMMERMLAGWTVAEAAWNATPVLSWMTTMVGDPLYRPFAVYPDADRKREADYRALRLAMLRWGKPEDRRELFQNLSEAAQRLESGTIYEFMGLHAQAGKPKAARDATPWLTKAAAAYRTPADQLRITLARADVLRRDGDRQAAIKVLRDAAEQFGKLPESEAARALLKQLRELP